MFRKASLLALLLLVGTVGVAVAQANTPTNTPTRTATNTPTSTGVPVAATPTSPPTVAPGHPETIFNSYQGGGQVNIRPPASTGCVDVTINGIQPGDLIVFYPPEALTTTDALNYNGARIKTNNTVTLCFTGSATQVWRYWQYAWFDMTKEDISQQPTPVTVY